MNKKTVLIYGATGYTGQLVARYFLKAGHTPVLAGRSERIEAIGRSLGCPVRRFGVDEAADHLSDVAVLVNTAGPFKYTQGALIQACLATQTHYLDLAGEVPELLAVSPFDEAAERAGVLLLPAAGFGVAPTDVVAQLATRGVTDPIHLTIAYATEGGVSQGTLRTVLGDVQQAGVRRVGGALVPANPADRHLSATIGGREFELVYNPWRADLVTAYWTTQVPFIETYTAFPKLVVRWMKGQWTGLRSLLLNHLLRFLPEGPSAKQLQKGRTYVQATAKNDQGQTHTVSLTGPDAYVLTAQSVVYLAQLAAREGGAGLKTPVQYAGTDWLLALEGVVLIQNNKKS